MRFADFAVGDLLSIACYFLLAVSRSLTVMIAMLIYTNGRVCRLLLIVVDRPTYMR